MAYTINLTDGAVFATVPDGTINTSSSMTLIGKNYAGYGQFLDDNFIRLLENGANTVPPGAPLTGQLWWDKTNKVMQVYNGSTFVRIGGASSSATQPAANASVQGDLWYNSSTAQLNVYTGNSWILVGPASSSGQGTSGAIVETVQDNLSNQHVVIKFYVANTVVGICSKDSTFSPAPNIAGFSSINPGMQLSTAVSNALFWGTASDSNSLGGAAANAYMSAITNTSTTGTLGVLNNGGLTVGANQDAKISVNTGVVTLQNQTSNGNLLIRVAPGGVATTAINVNGSTGAVGVGNVTNLNSNGVGNIGSASSYFNTVFATATTALYADVAERFAADDVLAPGTVVELGGAAEITKSLEELSENVFGVVSTRAAYLMNSGAGTDDTHPPIAMTGRVPVRVVGIARKGDRLVSAGAGLARAAAPGEATPFNVIGRALEDKLDDTEGMLEAIVTIK